MPAEDEKDHRSSSVKATLIHLYLNRGEVLEKTVGYQESLENYRTMERLAAILGDEIGRLRARVEAGYRMTLLGRLDQALAIHRQLAEEILSTDDEFIKNRNEQCLAIVLRLLGRYEEALAVQERSIHEISGDEARYYEWLNSRGHTLWRMGRYQEAIDTFTRVLSWAEQHSRLVFQATAHNNLGLVYSDMEMLEEARHHHQESLRLRTTLHDKSAMCSSFLNLGNVMVQMGEVEKGLELWGRALEISHRMGDAATEAMIENNMGEVCYSRGDYSGALAHFEKSLKMKEALNLVSYLDSSLEGLAKTYYELRKEPGFSEKCRFYGERLLKLEAAKPHIKDRVKKLLDTMDMSD